MRKTLLFITIILAMYQTSTNALAGNKSDVFRVQSAYLYNFTKFLKWPNHVFPNENDPFVIGIFGPEDVNGKYDSINNKFTDKRVLQVRYLKNIEETKVCHLLVIADSEHNRTGEILNSLKGRPIVTVSGIDNFAKKGGAIQFITIRGRLRFIINLKSFKSHNVTIDSRLLSLALEVIGT